LISENTILILGAGASKPYGYPTALELRKEIIHNFMPRFKSIIGTKYNDLDFTHESYVKNLNQMIEVFKKSSTGSIDLFLSRNKNYYLIGKQIITFLLADYEMKSKFREAIKERKYDWYFTLYNILTKDVITPDDISIFSKNKISVITFNYDRSLEHFIYESLFNSFITKRTEVDRIMRDFKVIHVYGKLAPLPWEIEGGDEYGSKKIRDNYNEYSNNLKIIYDERESCQQEIKDLISDAKKIIFLGFGFAEENLEAIGVNKPIFKRGQQIYGTAMGLTHQEIYKIQSLFKAINKEWSADPYFENCDSLKLLRDYF
jgi:hypothetical protein